MNIDATSSKLYFREVEDYDDTIEIISQQDQLPEHQILRVDRYAEEMFNSFLAIEEEKEKPPQPIPEPNPDIELPSEPIYNEFLQDVIDPEDSSDIDKEAADLRNEQELFLEKLGRALYSTYVKDAIAPALKIATDTFSDNDLIETLKPLLKEALLDKIFFPDPSNLNTTSKDILKSILCWIDKFFEGLNQSVKACEKIDVKKVGVSREEIILDAFVQKLYVEGTVPLDAKDPSEWILLLLKEIVAKAMFKIPKFESLKPIQKCGVIPLAKLIYNFGKPFGSMKVFNFFLVRILEGSITGHNPFDRLMPTLKQFDASDVDFSNEIDVRIRRIDNHIIQWIFVDNIIKRKGAELLLKVIPNMGEKVQQGLNRLFNTGTTLTPGILIAQILFDNMPGADSVKKVQSAAQLSQQNRAMRASYLQRLNHPKPTFNLSKIEEEMEKSAWIKDSLLGKDTMRVELLLKKRLPKGSRSQALDVMQKVYKLAQHNLFRQLLLVHLLKGISAGVLPS